MPVPTSDALAVTVTFVPKAKLDPDAGDVTETTGGAASILIDWDLTAPLFPATSTEKNLIVAVADTVKGPV